MAKKKKKKLQEGGYQRFNQGFMQYQQPIQQGAALLGNIASAGGGTGTVVGGGLQGAAMGAAFGPIGAAGGAVLGTVTGFAAKKKEEERQAEIQKEMNVMETKRAMANAGKVGVKKGGTLLSKSLKPLQGGGLVPVSEDAVEVKANNPELTDSVELEEAYVDHGEIIDNKNRVFSEELGFAKIAKKLEKMKSDNPRFKASNDRIENQLNDLFNEQETMKKESKMGLYVGGKLKSYKAGGGELTGIDTPKKGITEEKIMFKTPAEAKAYYKQKAIEGLSPEDKVFYEGILSGQNTNIDADSFLALKNPTPLNIKEHVIQPKTEPMGNVLGRAYGLSGLAEGGVLRKKLDRSQPAPKKGSKPMEIKGPPQLGDEAKYFLNKPKKKMWPGGNFDIPDFQKLAQQQARLSEIGPAGTLGSTSTAGVQLGSGPTLPPTNTPSSKMNFDQGLNTMATFAPNVVNSMLQKKLQGPPKVATEGLTSLKRVSARPQLASASRAFNQAKETVTAGTAGSGNLASATGSLLAKRLEAENQIYDDVNQQNIGIGNQEALMNQGVKARNVERQNRFRESATEFGNRKLQLSSENLANLSGKIQAQGRERNMMGLDKLKAKIIAGQYGDSGVLARLGERFKTEDPDSYEELKSMGFFKLGGVLPKKLSKKRRGKIY